MDRDRDAAGRARQSRPRDALGRPLAYGQEGVQPVSEQMLPAAETIVEATRLLDEGRPFAAHEVFEARWKAAPNAERDLWQGLAQLCVAVTHALRGNGVGAARLIERGREHLAQYGGTESDRYGLDLDAWMTQAQAAVDAATPTVR
jgi:predicted metal-dependent hydrolase